MEPHGDSKKRSITRRAPRGIEKRLQAVDAVGERLRGSSASHVTVRGSRLEGGTPDATAAQARWVSPGCLRCLLLVMCTYPFAKKALTLHLVRGEGRERYFGCNLMQRKVLASSHQHLMAEAPATAPKTRGRHSRAAAVSPNGGGRRAAAEERHSRELARDEP